MSSSGQGQQDLSVANSDFNTMSFLISQALALVACSTLVQIKAVTRNDTVSPIGFVDVLPLVNMLDGAGTASKHDTVYNLPYARLQGGKNAVICDPCVGDIGVAVFADRDISVVKTALKQSNPGTFRKHSMSDGIYLFTVLSNQAPQQYVQFVQDNNGNPTGINITDINNNTIVMDANGITINGVLIDRNSNVTSPAEITAMSGGGSSVTLSQHLHSGVQGGSSDTAPPVGGT